MKKKWTQRMKKWFSTVSDIPEDIVLDVPKLILTGQTRLSIENYRSVLNFSDNQLILALEKGELHIQGEQFTLEVILQKEIILNGLVKSVQFIEQ
ncbi:MAG: sporulation protein YqfC [Sporolactobacillus sp.]